MTWQPTASIDNLRKRAVVMASIRDFFAKRNVLAVETPTLSHAGVTDVHLHTFATTFYGPGYAKGAPLNLMTSPEFHMKRLLAAGSGCIYQLSKVFRNEEGGRHHNAEFTMLEWYRVGFDHHQLMDEMAQLLQLILACEAPTRLTYQQAFLNVCGICPLEASLQELQACAAQHDLADVALQLDRDGVLQLLFSCVIEAKIGQSVPVFVYDFPASQAALAKLNADDPRVADRFEVYFKGIELANGFHELTDAKEQLARFEADNVQREAMGLPAQVIDHQLIAALAAGMPDCAGVALGIDRLVMLALGAEHIDQVLSFPLHRA
nr:elongation factor P--(R)-beta-lysine ligase [Vibrio stylophorae]